MADSKQKIVKILENKKVTGNYFKASFVSPWPVRTVKPGQFMEIKIGGGIAPFLRKPLGVHSVKRQVSSVREKIEILYEVVGEGTELLSRKKPSETLDIIGPLGNGFNLAPNTSSLTPILVAGGIGVAPLVALAEKIAAGRRSPAAGKTLVLLGARTKRDILCEKEFKKLNCEVKIATDDGSKGHKGFVTDLLKAFLSTIDYRLLTIYACGPKPMLKETAKISVARKIPCQVLLEEYMACGVGVCLGCAVMTKGGYKMVCKDGPVFEADEIAWD